MEGAVGGLTPVMGDTPQPRRKNGAGGAPKRRAGAVEAVLGVKRKKKQAAPPVTRPRRDPSLHPRWRDATEQQRDVCMRAYNGDSLMILGAAGTGKTFIEVIIADSIPCMVTATTGTAASLINGKTTYSALNDEPDMPFHIWLVQRSSAASAAFRGITAVIIEEASMFGEPEMERLDRQLRVLGERVMPGRKLQPFGGYQMIFVLDLTQLPPVSTPNRLICDTKPFVALSPGVVTLTRCFRQRTEQRLLMHLIECTRYAVITPLSVLIALVMERIAAQMWDRVEGIYASPQRAPAHEENARRIERYAHQYELPVRWENGITGPGTYRVGDREVKVIRVDSAKSRLPPPANVVAVGAPVCILVNISALRVTNGMVGELLSLDTEEMIATVAVGAGNARRIVRLGPQRTYSLMCKVQGVAEPMVVNGTAIPIQAAFAWTIHRLQGSTLTGILRLYLENMKMPYGLLYTGVSRVTHLNNLMARGLVRAMEDTRMHPSAEAFLCAHGFDVPMRRAELVAESAEMLPNFPALFHEETSIPVASLRFILAGLGTSGDIAVRTAFPAWMAAGLGGYFKE